MFPNIFYIIGPSFCGLVLSTLILVFFLIQKKLKIKNDSYFFRTLIMGMILCIVDIVSIILNTDHPDHWFTILLAKAYLVLMLVTLLSMILYIVGDTVDKKRYRLIFWTCVILGAAVSAGMMFTDLEVVDIYTEGTATILMYSSAAICILYIVIFTIKYRKQMQSQKPFVIWVWMSAWATFALIQFLFPKIIIVSFGMALGSMVCYIKIEALENLVDRDTGLFNWNAYMKYIKSARLQNQRCSVIYLMPNDSFYDIDEKTVKSSLSGFNELLRKRKDVVAFSIKSEYLLIIEKNSLEYVRAFLTSEREKDYVVGKTYNAYFIEDIALVESQEDLESIISYAKSLNADSDESFITIDKKTIESYNNIENTEKLINNAIEHDNILVYYQPIYSTKENKITCAEALVRIKDTNGKIIPPGMFIPVAEASGKVNQLDKIVFEKVCKFISSTDMKSLGLHYIEVNLSGEQLSNKGLAEDYIRIMKKYKVPVENINLEITESKNVEFRKTLEKNLNKLMNYGVSFSLDDYGTGYSNLNYVLELPVQIIKFDKQMTDAFFEKGKAMYVMESSINLFKSLNYQIVIEGVETNQQLDTLTKMDIDYIQGYLFSKPIPEEEFVKFTDDFNNKTGE